MSKHTTKKSGIKPAKPVERKLTPATFERLNNTRNRIMRGRTFADDSVDIIRQFRRGGAAPSRRA